MIIEIKGRTLSGKTKTLINLSNNYNKSIFLTKEELARTLYKRGLNKSTKVIEYDILSYSFMRQLKSDNVECLCIDNLSLFDIDVRHIPKIEKMNNIDIIYTLQN